MAPTSVYESDYAQLAPDTVPDLVNPRKSVESLHGHQSAVPRFPTSCQRGLRPEDGCIFCSDPYHIVRACPIASEYVNTFRCLRLGDGRLVLPNGKFVPRRISGRNMKERVDTWISTNTQYKSGSEPHHSHIHTPSSRIAPEFIMTSQQPAASEVLSVSIVPQHSTSQAPKVFNTSITQSESTVKQDEYRSALTSAVNRFKSVEEIIKQCARNRKQYQGEEEMRIRHHTVNATLSSALDVMFYAAKLVAKEIQDDLRQWVEKREEEEKSTEGAQNGDGLASEVSHYGPDSHSHDLITLTEPIRHQPIMDNDLSEFSHCASQNPSPVASTTPSLQSDPSYPRPPYPPSYSLFESPVHSQDHISGSRHHSLHNSSLISSPTTSSTPSLCSTPSDCHSPHPNPCLLLASPIQSLSHIKTLYPTSIAHSDFCDDLIQLEDPCAQALFDC